MMTRVKAAQNPQQLLAAARAGNSDSLGELLQTYWNYLKLLVSTRINPKFRSRFTSSDVVQETFCEAHRNFGKFRGETEAELMAWLRKILVNKLARLVEQHATAKKRNVRREVSLQALEAAVDRSSVQLESLLVARGPSPSADARRRESIVILANGMAKLPADYREVLILRHLEGLAFEDIAQRLTRSPGATRMLWLRALDRLRCLLNAETSA